MTTITSSSVAKPLVPAFRPLQDALSPYADLMVRVAGAKSVDALIGTEI